VINTARGRLKDKNLHSRPAVAVLIVDPANPYRYLQIQAALRWRPKRARAPALTTCQ